MIVKVNNQDVTPDSTLSYIVSRSKVGSSIPIELIRDGQRKTVNVTIGERPPEDQLAGDTTDDDDNGNDSATPSNPSADESTKATIGLGFQALTPDLARRLGLATTLRGVVINYVDPSSDAGAQGFQARDVILQINNVPVSTVQAAAAQIAAAKKAGKKTVLLFAQRGTNPARYIGVQLKD